MEGERMRVTVVLEYAVDPDRYPGTKTAAERAEVDREAFTRDPDTLATTVSVEEIKRVTVTPITVTL